MNLNEAIRNLDPFECSDWSALCSAVIEEYDYDTWRTSLTWVLGTIWQVKQFEKMHGSWNVPIRAVPNYQEEKSAFKVLRCHRELENNHFVKQYAFEFHASYVPKNQWIKAEISGSPGLTGIKNPENAKFHMLYDERQAVAYLGTRTHSPWFQPQEAVIHKVIGREWQTIDLVYIPPKQWVWGVDANEMYVEL